MEDTAQGKFCSQCSKDVIDFTTWEKEAIIEYLSKNKSCGIFRNELLDHGGKLPIVQIKNTKQNYITKAVASLSVFVFALIGCDTAPPKPNIVGALSYEPQDAEVKKTDCTQTLGVPIRPRIEAVDVVQDTFVTKGEIKPSTVVGLTAPPAGQATLGIDLDTEAQFPGGDDSLSNYLAQNINYPRHETAAGIIYVGFDVTTVGEIINIKIVHSFENATVFEEEVIRVVSAMPDWVPASSEGVPTPSNFVLPISFSGE